ncbi:hypothetical protein JEQ12_012164 [Ovis aries]|uniref:Uncharacterized protein n=1 Tax=Ovis aries TaxID=9940 RepID=A0A836CQ99_SHEEP|nr:hypothetical protein JEQ12_012164 [Ovis aries]
MAAGRLPCPRPSREPRSPTHWPTRRTSDLCQKPGSKWSSSWVVARPVRAGRGLCSTWRGPPTPGCRTSCQLTWTSGGHSSSWPGSPTAPSHSFGRKAVLCRARPCPTLDPLPGEDHGALSTSCGRPCFTLGLARRRPHLKCQHLDFCPC